MKTHSAAGCLALLDSTRMPYERLDCWDLAPFADEADVLLYNNDEDAGASSVLIRMDGAGFDAANVSEFERTLGLPVVLMDSYNQRLKSSDSQDVLDLASLVEDLDQFKYFVDWDSRRNLSSWDSILLLCLRAGLHCASTRAPRTVLDPGENSINPALVQPCPAQDMESVIQWIDIIRLDTKDVSISRTRNAMLWGFQKTHKSHQALRLKRLHRYMCGGKL